MIPEAINTAQEKLEISNTEDVENVPPSNVLQKPRHLLLHLENLLKNWDPGKNEDALNKFTNRFRYPRMK